MVTNGLKVPWVRINPIFITLTPHGVLKSLTVISPQFLSRSPCPMMRLFLKLPLTPILCGMPFQQIHPQIFLVLLSRLSLGLRLQIIPYLPNRLPLLPFCPQLCLRSFAHTSSPLLIPLLLVFLLLPPLQSPLNPISLQNLQLLIDLLLQPLVFLQSRLPPLFSSPSIHYYYYFYSTYLLILLLLYLLFLVVDIGTNTYFNIPTTVSYANNTLSFKKCKVGKITFCPRTDWSGLVMVGTESQAQAILSLKDLDGMPFLMSPDA